MNQEILSALKIVAVTFLCSALIMPGMKKIAFHIGALDIPRSDEGNRHIHKRVMPKLGGVGIFLAFLVGYMLFGIESIQMNSILIGSFIIILTGIIDDIKSIRASRKLLGQLIAACIIVFYGGILLNNITAFGYTIDFGILSYPLTIFFIVACTNIINLIIKEDVQLNFNICELIIKTNIKNVNCYNLQPFMIEYLDKYGVLVESRNEILYLSNFMLQNNLSIFSSMFYKMTIQIDLPMSVQDEEDFEAFIKINKYLKTINVNYVNKNDLEYIINTLRKNNKKNIKIVIHDNISNEETIEYLREFNKRKSKRYKIYFRLDYSDDYLKDNLLKQTNNSILKTCGYIIILIIAVLFIYVFYDNYNSMKNDEDTKTSIKEIISLDNTETIINEMNKDLKDNEKKVINKDVASVFKNVNPETVGWLKVPNTNIDYPVVQTNNNSYYLNHNIFFKDDKNGWVFMDYHSDVVNLSDNLVIYAHNRYYNGIMFGNIQNMMRYNWYSNPDNHIITFKTLYETLEYEIFSLYKIETTTDYLQVIFPDNQTKMKMFDLIKSRSIYNFNVDLNENDKIITLSTCADENNKYVVHAVLKRN